MNFNQLVYVPVGDLTLPHRKRYKTWILLKRAIKLFFNKPIRKVYAEKASKHSYVVTSGMHSVLARQFLGHTVIPVYIKLPTSSPYPYKDVGKVFTLSKELK